MNVKEAIMERTFSTLRPAQSNWTDADYEAAIDDLHARMKIIMREMEASAQRLDSVRAENHALLEEIKRMRVAGWMR
jgi:hypothetical protein